MAESKASILKIFSGWLSDKWGRRKPIMVVGYGLGACKHDTPCNAKRALYD